MPYYYGATGASEDGIHRWQPHTRRPLVLGSGRGSGLARVMLQEMRWRKPPRYIGLRIFSVVLTFVLHVVIFVLMSLGRAPGPSPQAADVATVEVRLINPPEPPPPPPPPIKMPVRKTGPAAQPKPHRAKRAPTPATPLPTPSPATPKVSVTPEKPQVEPTPVKPVQAHATASPPAVKSPTIATQAPKVVEEMSRQALPAPELDAIQIVPTKQASARLRPIPARNDALTVSVGKADLKIQAAAPPQPQPLAPAQVRASAPDVPVVQMQASVQKLKPQAHEAPTIAPQITAPQVQQSVAAEPLPLPQVPTATSMPDLNLPIADVPVPQAPKLQMPGVQIERPSTDLSDATETAAASSTARAASAAKPHSSSVRSADTWVPANDQFQSLSKQAGGHSAGVRQSSGSKGRVQVAPHGNSDVMARNSDRLGYKSTIFDQYWAPLNETILDTFLRHMIERLTVKHTFHVAPGVRVHCFVGPLAVFAGCGGDPPRKASSKSHDKRLNMAPARSLVPGEAGSAPAHKSGTPSLDLDNTAKCVTARVAGAPPPPGCKGAPEAGKTDAPGW